MKKSIGLFLAFLTLAVVGKLNAANSTTNEPAAPDGNFGLSQIAVDYTSTGTTNTERSFVTRRLHAENDGTQLVIYGVHKSSQLWVASSTNTYPRDLIAGGTVYNFGTIDNSTGLTPNTNVIAIASPGRNILIKRVRSGTHVGAPVAGSWLRIWDSRGSTSSADSNGAVDPAVIKVIDDILTTGTVRDLDLWISSGINVKFFAPNGANSAPSGAAFPVGKVWIDYDEFNTNNTDSR